MSDVAVVPGTDPYKRICGNCHRMVDYREILIAPNPFDRTFTVNGCPLCKDVTTFTTSATRLAAESQSAVVRPRLPATA